MKRAAAKNVIVVTIKMKRNRNSLLIIPLRIRSKEILRLRWKIISPGSWTRS